MKNILRFAYVCFFLVTGYVFSVAQGLPPGWDYSPTPSNHIISIPLTAEPNINGFLLNPGDYIGVFYTDGNGDLACGGAAEWLGNQNTGIIAFGDDSFTGVKDGFSSGEVIGFKFYSWSVEKEYDAEAICNDNLPVTCNVFISNGLSGVDSLWANGFYIVASASPENICFGSNTQLLVEPSGGSDDYIYSWTSEPPGFNATTYNPLASPQVNTTFFISVQDNDEILESEVYVEVLPQPVSNAGEDLTICEDSFVLVTGQQSNGESFYWSTDGDGTFDNIYFLSAYYMPGIMDIENGGVGLSLTVNPIEPCQNPAVSGMELTIIGLPEIETGDDQTICEDQSVFASALLLNAIQLAWSTNGDGTFSDPAQIETEYFPGEEDLQNGSVEITAAAFALSPCLEISFDNFQVEFDYLPVVNAGDNALICEDENVLLTGTAINFSSVTWETSGDGSFENAGEIETIYYPGNNDIVNGNVEIILIAQPDGACIVIQTDTLSVTIVENPNVFAGEDVSICESSNVQFNGSAGNYDEVAWASQGDGTFSDPNSLNTIYYPGSQDIQNTQVAISLTAQPLFPCSLPAGDNLVTHIEPMPAADAGDDYTIPVNESHELQGQATNYSSINWDTGGDGTFNNNSVLNAIYTPGSEDNNNTIVILTLNALPNSPCLIGDFDEMTLTIDTLVNISSVDRLNGFDVFPNPTSGELFIKIPDDAGSEFVLALYDRSGICVKKNLVFENEISATQPLKMNLDFEPGLYFLQIVYGKMTVNKKIILLKN